MKKLLLLSAVFLLLLFTVPSALAQREAVDGMVRVQLASLGSPTQLTLTISGQYGIEGEPGITLKHHCTLTASLSRSGNRVVISQNGTEVCSGTAVKLVRIGAEETGGIAIAESRQPDGFYPGSLELKVQTAADAQRSVTAIVHVYLEDYLLGVLPWEMGNDAGLEALKAQAVAARTYAIVRKQNRAAEDYDVTDTTLDQVYNAETDRFAHCSEAIETTRGLVITWNGRLAETLYTASNGGWTESPETAWGAVGFDYLSVKRDPYDRQNPDAPLLSLSVKRDPEAAGQNAVLMSLLRGKLRSVRGSRDSVGNEIRIVTIDRITPHTPVSETSPSLYTMLDFAVTYTADGEKHSIVLTFDIFRELEAELGLSLNGAQNELWSVVSDSTGFTIQVRRYGHGIGMSQRGAMQMSKLGFCYEEILSYYYEGCRLQEQLLTETRYLSAETGDLLVLYDTPAETPDPPCAAIVELSGPSMRLGLLEDSFVESSAFTGVGNGCLLRVLGAQGDWLLAEQGSVQGYAPADCLRLVNGTPYGGEQLSSVGPDQWGIVTGNGWLNLRSAPSTDADVLWRIEPGEIVCVLMDAGSWINVQYETITGWVSSDYLRLTCVYPGKTVNTPTARAYVTLNGGSGLVNLRSSPSTGAEVIAQLPAGTAVTLMSDNGTWSHVIWNSSEGWIMSCYLSDQAQQSQGSGAAVPTAAPASLYAYVNTNGSGLNMRSLPSGDAELLAVIPQYTRIPVYSTEDGWCRTCYDGQYGYVMGYYLLTDDGLPMDDLPSSPANITPAPTGSASTVRVTTGGGPLNLRALPSTEAPVLLSLDDGVYVEIKQRGDVWCLVAYGNTTGYVMSRYLELSARTLHVVTDSGLLNLRSEPSAQGEVIRQLASGTPVIQIEYGESWSKVQLSDGTTGWCMTAFLTSVQPSVTPSPTPETTAPQEPEYDDDGRLILYITDPNGAAFRAMPYTDGDLLGTIVYGDSVSLIVDQGEWSFVLYNGTMGYVQSRLLSEEKPPAKPSAAPEQYTSTGLYDATLAAAWNLKAAVGTDGTPLNVRAWCQTSAPILMTVENGTVVDVLEKGNTWCKISYGGNEGYCVTRYLQIN